MHIFIYSNPGKGIPAGQDGDENYGSRPLNKKCGPECEPHFQKQTTKPVIKISL